MGGDVPAMTATTRRAGQRARGGALAACAACAPGPRAGEHDVRRRPPIGAPIDRIGRPLTGNALIGLLAPEAVSNARKEQYNRAAVVDWPQFVGDLEHSL